MGWVLFERQLAYSIILQMFYSTFVMCDTLCVIPHPFVSPMIDASAMKTLTITLCVYTYSTIFLLHLDYLMCSVCERLYRALHFLHYHMDQEKVYDVVTHKMGLYHWKVSVDIQIEMSTCDLPSNSVQQLCSATG